MAPTDTSVTRRRSSKKIRLTASWEPQSGSPEPLQLGPEIGGSGGKPPSGPPQMWREQPITKHTTNPERLTRVRRRHYPPQTCQRVPLKHDSPRNGRRRTTTNLGHWARKTKTGVRYKKIAPARRHGATPDHHQKDNKRDSPSPPTAAKTQGQNSKESSKRRKQEARTLHRVHGENTKNKPKESNQRKTQQERTKLQSQKQLTHPKRGIKTD